MPSFASSFLLPAFRRFQNVNRERRTCSQCAFLYCYKRRHKEELPSTSFNILQPNPVEPLEVFSCFVASSFHLVSVQATDPVADPWGLPTALGLSCFPPQVLRDVPLLWPAESRRCHRCACEATDHIDNLGGWEKTR